MIDLTHTERNLRDEIALEVEELFTAFWTQGNYLPSYFGIARLENDVLAAIRRINAQEDGNR